MLASDVMDSAASSLNDTARSIFTYTAQLPYLNMALDQLQQEMENSNVAFTNSVPAFITVPAGITNIGGLGGPGLPPDIVEIQQLWERVTGTTLDYVRMDRVDFLPLNDFATAYFGCWSYDDQIIHLPEATTSIDVKIQYIRARLSGITDPTNPILLINAKLYLAYKTAALCAQFIGENKERADILEGKAGEALYLFLNINTKGRQSQPVRHRPFRAGFKNRNFHV